MISDRGSPRGIVSRRECRDVPAEGSASEPTSRCHSNRLLAVQKGTNRRGSNTSRHEANIAGRP